MVLMLLINMYPEYHGGLAAEGMAVQQRAKDRKH
jgi:hypothetical protein